MNERERRDIKYMAIVAAVVVALLLLYYAAKM